MASIPFLVAIPLASAFLIPMVGRRLKAAGEIITAVAALALSYISFSLLFSVAAKKVLIYKMGNWMPPAGIPMAVDALSAFMLAVVNLIAFLIAVYSVGYIRKYTDRWKFYTIFCVMLTGINGVLVAADLFNLYVFLEIAAIAGYFLVAFGTGPEELEAAFKYAVMGIVASIFILFGIALLYGYTSTLNMADMALVLNSKGAAQVVLFVSALFLMGFGLKAAMVPFHAWLPYAHSSAPAPISAMLSGISIKVLGIYALARIFFNVFGMSPQVSTVLITLAVLSMVVGSILAFGQTDIKRLFAYSSISHIGYIALGLGIGTPLSVAGALFYLANHSLFKSLLFLNSGAIEHSTGTRDLNKISDAVSNAPITGYTTLTGALSICGIPPLGGFWGKLIIIFACIQADRPVLAFVAAFVGILTLGYYFKALTPALFDSKAKKDRTSEWIKVPWAMNVSMIILAIFSILAGLVLLPGMGQEVLKNAASVIISGKDYAVFIFEALK